MRLRPGLVLLFIVPIAAGLGCSLIVDTGGAGACLNGLCAPGFSCVEDRCVAKSDGGTPGGGCATPCRGSQVCFTGKCVQGQTIVGTRLIQWWPDDGPLAPQPPAGLTDIQIGALLSHANGYSLFPGSFKSDGRFEIPDVPASNYFLRFARPGAALRLVETSATTLDLGESIAGRPNVATATMPTPVTLRLSGLAPLMGGGNTSLQVVSSNAALWLGDEPALSPGSTSLAWTYDWSQSLLGLLPEGELRDVTFIHQMAETDQGPYRVSNTVAWQQLPAGFTVLDGQSQSMDVQLYPADQTGTLAADWRVAQFAGQIGYIHPRAQEPEYLLFVAANAHVQSLWPRSGAPGLLTISASFDPPSSAPSSLTVGPVAYGRFLPPMWRELLGVIVGASVPFTAPGASSEMRLYASMVGYRDLSGGAVIVAPALGPVRSPTVGGASATEPLSGVGTMPTLSWLAPELGKATSYRLVLWELFAEGPELGSQTKTVLVVDLLPSSTAFRVPGGVLAPGKTYVGTIAAHGEGGDPTSTAPFRRAFPYSSAESIIGPFSP